MDRLINTFGLGQEEENTHNNVDFCPMSIDGDNNMPVLPNKPINGVVLDTCRKVSSIPRAGHNTNWVYPSPMQFYNALLLKNKGGEDPTYIKDAVNAHNDVNELTWKKILDWERMHKSTCSNPTLRRFAGRYNTTPKALMNRLFTRFDMPFDRHDWLINRCGRDIRYIIDYYDDPQAKDDLQVYIDVRPALDSISNVYDRIRYPFYHLFNCGTKF